MASELTYDLITRTDAETQRILDNVIFLMFPCLNPDGLIMTTDWYNKYLDTEYEGCSLPWLYHKYAGHDNNRDAFMLNLVESQYVARVLFQEWHPQVFQDHHEMGSYGARLYVAPYCGTDSPARRPTRLAGNKLVRGTHGIQTGGSGENRGPECRTISSMEPPRLPLDWELSQHCQRLDRICTHQVGDTPIYPQGAITIPRGATSERFPQYKPQTNFSPSVGRRLVAITRHRRATENCSLGLA